MKKKWLFLLILISLISSSFYSKINRVHALRERACIGVGCPEEIVSHYDYTDVYELGLRYVNAGALSFTYDYYIRTYVVYENGFLTDVYAPIVTHGDTFWSETADYSVDVSQSYRASINSNRTQATVTLTLRFTFTNPEVGVFISDPLIISYTVS